MITAIGVVVVGLMAVAQLQTEGPNRIARERIVREFISLMASDRTPSIAHFEKFFGPHNEQELILQTRVEGVRDPLHETVDEAVVERVNRRLLSPGRHPSLFLRCVRRHVPALSRGALAGVGAADVKAERGGLVRVTTPSGQLLFRFPDIEWYFGIGSGCPEHWIDVTPFLKDCSPRACCE